MEKGEKYTFTVKGSKVAGGNLYYQVNAFGHEYDIKAFDFQRRNRPQRLQCIIKDISASGEPVFMQDISAVLPQIYTIGDVYDFKVKAQNPAGYYDVADDNGLMFRLYPGNHRRLPLNETVKCQVRYINKVQMGLELVQELSLGIPFYTLDQLLALDSTKGGMEPWLKALFRRLPELAEAREQLAACNPLWVMTAADAVARHLTEWLNSQPPRTDGRKRPHRRTPMLRAFNAICTNLLENSDYLRKCPPEERVEYQDRLNKIITHTSDYVSALQKIIDKEDQKFIDGTLERLKLSGYLYKPEERMRVAMALFTLRKKAVSQYIDDIFDIIRDSHSNDRFMKLFSKAFVEMLDMYIANESRFIDVLTSSSTNRTAIQQMIRALSLRLLLPADETEEQRALYRSKLYRYVTLEASVNSDRMVGKSLSTLLNSQAPLEFGWNELNDINFLCSRIAVGDGASLSEETFLFEGENALMSVKGDSFTFTPLVLGGPLRAGIPSGLFGKRSIRFLLNERTRQKVNARRPTIDQLRTMWKEVEESLFGSGLDTRSASSGITPDVGDIVDIVVESKVPGRLYEYRARIVSEGISGEGIITPHDIVAYPINPGIEAFREPGTGYPCIYRARVEERNDATGELRFSMRSLIHNYLSETLSVGDEGLVQVTMANPKGYVCISEGGFSLSFPKCGEDLRLNDFCVVRLENIYPSGEIRASFVDYPGEDDKPFSQNSAFKYLLQDYCGDRYLYPEELDDTSAEEESLEKARSAQNFIGAERMRELIHLIDREGMMQTDHILTYNYLAVGRIMSRLLGDSQLAAYFYNRMELVRTITSFGDTGKIDDDTLMRLLGDNRDFMSTYPDIEARLTQLRLINRLDKPVKTEGWIWDVANHHPDARTSALARLVVSYNMLEHANLYEVRRALKRKIYQLMELKVQLPDTLKVAEEDQYTELKTSLFYPAGNRMQPNEQIQITEILRVISSFLNASGGRLYIGVADNGYASGLDEDFAYLNKGYSSYDLATVKDRFDRRLRDAVHNRMGRVANSKISTEFEVVGDRVIYRVDIDPSSEVALVDGVAYERQGKSKWMIPAADLAKFREQRSKLAEI